MNLQGKSIVVTGGAQGIGASFCRALREAGAQVTIFDLVPPATDDFAYHEVDVADTSSVERAASSLERVDGLVNNAALFSGLSLRPFWDIPVAEWDRMFAVNVRGPFVMARALVDRMPPGSTIINIASGTVYKGTPGMMHYVASKGALVSMTRCMARELGSRQIRVNAIAPGLVMTDAVRANEAMLAKLGDASVSGRALARHEVPEDLTGALVFLCSSSAAFITGHVLVVDGGSVMR